MRHPLTAAIPAILLALGACKSDSLTGPSSTPLPGQPGTSTSTTSSAPTAPTASTTSGTTATGGTAGSTSGGTSSSTTMWAAGGTATGGGGRSTGGTSGSTSGSSATGGAGSSSGGTGGNGASSRVLVSGSFQVVVPGTRVVVGYRSEPQPAAAGGVCLRDEAGQPNGTWQKTTNGTTSTHALHVHCTIYESTGEQTITVTVAEPATYVQSPSGNLNLNFDAACAEGESGAPCADRSIHYNKNADYTTGAGLLRATGSDGSAWTIDLAQLSHTGSSRVWGPDGIAPLLKFYGTLVATSATGLTTSNARFSW